MENKYHDTVYYENWTTDGEEGEYHTCRARWATYEEALDAMANYENAWRKKGTGWIVKTTIKAKINGQIEITEEKVYEKMM